MDRSTKATLAIAGMLALAAAVQVYAFHWGVITPDTVEQYGQALSGRYDDWHPPVTAWLWHLILRVSSGTAGILLFDVALYWAGIGCLAASAFRRWGSGFAGLTIVVGLLPIPFGQMGSILKDPLLTALCLFASGVMVLEPPRMVQLFAAVLLAVATATRFNALFATLPLLIGAAPCMFFASRARGVATVMAGALLLAGSSWLINVAWLHPHRSEPIFSLVNFDLGGIAAHGGGNPYPSMTDDETRQMTRACYDVRLYNSRDTQPCEQVEDRLVAYAHRYGVSAISIWLHGIASAPIAYAVHRISHLNWNWRLFVPNVPDDAVYVMSEPNLYGLVFRSNWVTRVVLASARVMAWSPFGRPATWIVVAFCLLLIAAPLPSRKPIRMLAASSLCYGGAYAAVSVASDLRYNLWTMVAAMVASVFALGDIRAGARLERRPAFVALGILLAAFGIEIAGFIVGGKI